VTRVGAYDKQAALPADQFAIFTNTFDARSNLHCHTPDSASLRKLKEIANVASRVPAGKWEKRNRRSFGASLERQRLHKKRAPKPKGMEALRPFSELGLQAAILDSVPSVETEALTATDSTNSTKSTDPTEATTAEATDPATKAADAAEATAKVTAAKAAAKAAAKLTTDSAEAATIYSPSGKLTVGEGWGSNGQGRQRGKEDKRLAGKGAKAALNGALAADPSAKISAADAAPEAAPEAAAKIAASKAAAEPAAKALTAAETAAEPAAAKTSAKAPTEAITAKAIAADAVAAEAVAVEIVPAEVVAVVVVDPVIVGSEIGQTADQRTDRRLGRHGRHRRRNEGAHRPWESRYAIACPKHVKWCVRWALIERLTPQSRNSRKLRIQYANAAAAPATTTCSPLSPSDARSHGQGAYYEADDPPVLDRCPCGNHGTFPESKKHGFAWAVAPPQACT
jgi:hypothetical protein